MSTRCSICTEPGATNTEPPDALGCGSQKRTGLPPSRDRRDCLTARHGTRSRSPHSVLHNQKCLLQHFPVADPGNAQSAAADLRCDGLDKLTLVSVHRLTALFTPPIAIGIGVGWAA
jgi:hypothetical protein